MCNDNCYSFNRKQGLVRIKNILFFRAGVVDRVFARIGASDNLVQYQSTFMTEMLETAFILAQATQQSLVVVDEVGRYTRHLGRMMSFCPCPCCLALILPSQQMLLSDDMYWRA